jgi:hypothetical protein
MSNSAVWFRRVTLFGVVVNLTLCGPGIFLDNAVLDALQARPSLDPIWMSFSCLLLALLSFFYVPGALAPSVHRGSAILSVVSRFAGVAFFLLLRPGVYPMFGWLDLAFGVPCLLLLPGALASRPDEPSSGAGPSGEGV